MKAAPAESPALVSIPANPVPEGARAGFFETRDRVRLRYALFPRTAEVNRGTVCLIQGRTEFIEKYFETIADFQRRGFQVATFDFRGQGGSQRLSGNPRLGFVDRFGDYCTDLASFHAEILLPDCPPPFYLVGHSMGGLVALMAGAADRLMFERIFLSAPMLGLDGQPFGMVGSARLAEALCFLGLGRLPVRRRADRPPSEATFPGNPLTSDLPRYLRTVEVVRAAPWLAIGAPTLRWSAAALHAMRLAATDRFIDSFKAPLLMLAAARDEVVSSAATEQLGLRLKTGRHIVIPAARHELFMEADPIREQVLAAFDAFITNATG
jgi:lysophospholipase